MTVFAYRQQIPTFWVKVRGNEHPLLVRFKPGLGLHRLCEEEPPAS